MCFVVIVFYFYYALLLLLIIINIIIITTAIVVVVIIIIIIIIIILCRYIASNPSGLLLVMESNLPTVLVIRTAGNVICLPFRVCFP